MTSKSDKMKIYTIKLHDTYNTFPIFASWAYSIDKYVHSLLFFPRVLNKMVIFLERLSILCPPFLKKESKIVLFE